MHHEASRSRSKRAMFLAVGDGLGAPSPARARNLRFIRLVQISVDLRSQWQGAFTERSPAAGAPLGHEAVQREEPCRRRTNSTRSDAHSGATGTPRETAPSRARVSSEQRRRELRLVEHCAMHVTPLARRTEQALDVPATDGG